MTVVGAVSLFMGSFLPYVRAQDSELAVGGEEKIEIPAGMPSERIFDLAIHFIRLGRYDAANQFAAALLATEPDPVELMELSGTRELSDSVDWLMRLSAQETPLGDNCQAILDIIKKGEFTRRTDAKAIREQIERLSKGDRAHMLALDWLADSGEYAVPYLLDALGDPRFVDSDAQIMRALVRIGKSALNPLVMSLADQPADIKELLAEVLGQIGYPQSLPYLTEALSQEGSDGAAGPAFQAAIDTIVSGVPESGDGDVADQFYRLADNYYKNNESLRPDDQYPMANVWYPSADGAGGLQRVATPSDTFTVIMAMRCAERALAWMPDHADAIALWLAANARRAHLFVDRTDPTRAPESGTPDYYARAAGARYNHMVIARGLEDRAPIVVLAGIRSLKATAGPASLVGSEEYKQPLVDAMQYPYRAVQYEAALTLARSEPTEPFPGNELVIPILSEALGASSDRGGLVIGENLDVVNQAAGAIQDGGYRVSKGASIAEGLDEARQAGGPVDVVMLEIGAAGSNLKGAVGQIRSSPELQAAPVIILADSLEDGRARRFAEGELGVAVVDPSASDQAILDAVVSVSVEMGRTALSADTASSYALDAAEALWGIAVTGNSVFRITEAEPALLNVVRESSDEVLRITAARVLGRLASVESQRQMADLALSSGNPDTLRTSLFATVSDSAKRFGSFLTDAQVTELIQFVRDEQNDALRTAAAQALGALNLATNDASELIRAQSIDPMPLRVEPAAQALSAK
jgi:HEAT repeat protein